MDANNAGRQHAELRPASYSLTKLVAVARLIKMQAMQPTLSPPVTRYLPPLQPRRVIIYQQRCIANEAKSAFWAVLNVLDAPNNISLLLNTYIHYYMLYLFALYVKFANLR